MDAPLHILGIETSCDETAAALVRATPDGERTILSNLVLSQLNEHEAFGGVVPEIAARAHLDHLHTLIKATMDDADFSFEQLDGVAATCGPGLIGGVMVGMMAAKAIASAHNKPFIAVNHLEGHALTPRLTDNVEFPYLLLLVSGGHTQLLIAHGVGHYTRLGTTLDDACGECFDKSAKIMGIAFPGGPNLEKMAALCTDKKRAVERFALPRPMMHRRELDFSFSGLKTAVRVHVDKLPAGALKREDVADLSYAMQNAVAEILCERTQRALTHFIETKRPTSPSLVVSGGVAANKTIRSALERMAAKNATTLYTPPLNLCGDNAAMIAWAGIERLRSGLIDDLSFKARPRWPLDPDAQAKPGAGVKA